MRGTFDDGGALGVGKTVGRVQAMGGTEPMRHVSFADHKGADGKIDWKAYNAASEAARKADIDDGIYCYKCGTYILFGRGGGRQLCGQCRGLHGSCETTHDRLVRCPKCRNTFSPQEDHYDLYGDGEHQVTCCECDHGFEVSTRVSYSFTSPALIAPEATEDEE